MKTVEGFFFDGKVPDPVPATMLFTDSATMTTETAQVRFEIDQLWVSPRIGTSLRFIFLPDGGQFALADDTFLDRLPQESRSEGLVAWLETRAWVALVCVVIIGTMFLAGYFWGLPEAANCMALHVPMETEQALGRQTIVFFDKEGWVSSSKLDDEEREVLAMKFHRLIQGLAFKDYYDLQFRSSRFLGANALALPGGTIIVTDGLVNMAEHHDEVMAVLAHEIAHVELRHVIKAVLQQSALAIVVTAVTSDAATLSAAVAGLPLVLTRMKYSRTFETEADEYAFRLLRGHGYSPEAFASIIERLGETEPSYGGMSYLSSHPLSEERARRAREAAEQK